VSKRPRPTMLKRKVLLGNQKANLTFVRRVLVNTWNEANPGVAQRPNSARTLSGSLRSKK